MAANGKQSLLDHHQEIRQYDADELEFGRRLLCKDVLFLPLFMVWYFVLVWGVGPAPSSSQVVVSLEPPVRVLALQAFLASVAGVVQVFEVVMPPPRKVDDIYHALRYTGWWLMLTRHCITMQMLHLTFSFIGAAAGIQSLVRMTNGFCLFSGCSGFYVTIQYFSLVHYHPDFLARCERMASLDPPLNYRWMNTVLHSPALVLAVLDITLAKKRSAVATDCSLPASLMLCIFYVVFYLVFITINHRATGRWPYSFLKEFGTWQQWAAFLGMQELIFCALCMIAYCLSLLPSAW